MVVSVATVTVLALMMAHFSVNKTTTVTSITTTTIEIKIQQRTIECNERERESKQKKCIETFIPVCVGALFRLAFSLCEQKKNEWKFLRDVVAVVIVVAISPNPYIMFGWSVVAKLL